MASSSQRRWLAAQAALTALLHSRPFDLAICDVKLTDGRGLEVADLAAAVGVKAVVVTGHALDLRRGSLAPYDYLLKPLRGPELLAEIERRLAEKNGRPEVIPSGGTGNPLSKRPTRLTTAPVRFRNDRFRRQR